MKKLPYTATTRTGDGFEIEFPLHRETVDAVRVEQLLSALLQTIDHDVEVIGEMSNGDVLQALAMAMAIRARMIHAPNGVTQDIARGLLETSLEAMAEANHTQAQAGHA